MCEKIGKCPPLLLPDCKVIFGLFERLGEFSEIREYGFKEGLWGIRYFSSSLKHLKQLSSAVRVLSDLAWHSDRALFFLHETMELILLCLF